MDLKINLGQYIAQQLLEAESQPTIGLYPGAFKPPHKGHVEVVKKLLKVVDQVVVLISPKTSEGITADESVAVWNLYKDKGLFDGSVEVRVSAITPVKETYDVVKDNPDTEFRVAFNKGKISRYNNIEKHHNSKIFDTGVIEGVDATGLRMALLKDNNDEEIKKYLPDGVSVEEFKNAISQKASPEQQPDTNTPEPIKESPPINFEEDDYQDYILQNRSKIEKAAAVFNFPIDDMSQAFDKGDEVVLNDDIWKELQNSESFKIKNLEDAIAYSLKLGINPRPYIDYIKKKKELPFPLVLRYGDNQHYLVGGDVILSLHRALGLIPTILQGTLNLKTSTLPTPLHEDVEGKLNENQNAILKEFIRYAIKKLKIKSPPAGITLSYNTEDAKERSSFGTFEPTTNKIWLYVKNRNMADILRTLGHELVHRKQDEDGRIDMNSGETGSKIENEANAKAGVLLREFGQQNKNIYESKKKFGNYLFGDQESGVKIGWYDDEKEEDTPAEKELFNLLKKYADSEAETYSNINLDNLVPLLKKIKSQYPEIGEPKVSGYIYRGTSIPEEKLRELEIDAKTQPYTQGTILLNQTYSSRRQVQSWSTEYFPAAGFAVTTAERKGGIPVIMRTKASNADLYFNPKFMEKLSTQLEDETFNITNPIPVDIMVIENYQD